MKHIEEKPEEDSSSDSSSNKSNDGNKSDNGNNNKKDGSHDNIVLELNRATTSDDVDAIDVPWPRRIASDLPLVDHDNEAYEEDVL